MWLFPFVRLPAPLFPSQSACTLARLSVNQSVCSPPLCPFATVWLFPFVRLPAPLFPSQSACTLARLSVNQSVCRPPVCPFATVWLLPFVSLPAPLFPNQSACSSARLSVNQSVCRPPVCPFATVWLFPFASLPAPLFPNQSACSSAFLSVNQSVSSPCLLLCDCSHLSVCLPALCFLVNPPVRVPVSLLTNPSVVPLFARLLLCNCSLPLVCISGDRGERRGAGSCQARADASEGGSGGAANQTGTTSGRQIWSINGPHDTVIRAVVLRVSRLRGEDKCEQRVNCRPVLRAKLLNKGFIMWRFFVCSFPRCHNFRQTDYEFTHAPMAVIGLCQYYSVIRKIWTGFLKARLG